MKGKYVTDLAECGRNMFVALVAISGVAQMSTIVYVLNRSAQHRSTKIVAEISFSNEQTYFGLHTVTYLDRTVVLTMINKMIKVVDPEKLTIIDIENARQVIQGAIRMYDVCKSETGYRLYLLSEKENMKFVRKIDLHPDTLLLDC